MSISQTDKIIKSGTELCGWEEGLVGGPDQQFRLEGQHLVCNLDDMELVLDIKKWTETAISSKLPGTHVILWHNERTVRSQMWRLEYDCDCVDYSSSD